MPYFDRFDIAEAFHLFARHYHVGGDVFGHGADPEAGIFHRLRRIGFSPGLSLSRFDDPDLALSENGAEIYRALCEAEEN